MAIPFAWVKTEEEARNLIVLHCSYNQTRKVYQVKVDWDNTADGIRRAKRLLRQRFGFPVDED